MELMAEHALEGRGLQVGDGEVKLRCVVPSFRPDIDREVDLIEEVARLYGYDRIPEPTHTHLPNRTARELPADTLRRSARALLSGLGFRETYTNSMLRRETAQRFNHAVLNGGTEPGDVVETLNPISQEMSALRPSLLPGVLQVMSHNRKHGRRQLRFMEFGHVFHHTDREDTVIPGYAEHESFLLTLSGPHQAAGWDVRERAADFFDLKGAVEMLLQALRIPDLGMEPAYTPTPVTAYHLNVRSGDVPLGVVARLDEAAAGVFDLQEPVFFAELDWATLVGLAGPYMQRRYRAVSRYPVVERDLAVVIDRDQAVGPLLQTIRQAGGDLLQEAGVFDLYEGERIEAGRKSVAFALRFGADRTLQDEEVDARIDAVVTALAEAHGAVLRQ